MKVLQALLDPSYTTSGNNICFSALPNSAVIEASIFLEGNYNGKGHNTGINSGVPTSQPHSINGKVMVARGVCQREAGDIKPGNKKTPNQSKYGRAKFYNSKNSKNSKKKVNYDSGSKT